MKRPAFQAGDKVTLTGEFDEFVVTVPKLQSGVVYCVERVNLLYDNQWLRLVGVREHKIRCRDDRGAMAIAFRLVNRARGNAWKGGT